MGEHLQVYDNYYGMNGFIDPADGVGSDIAVEPLADGEGVGADHQYDLLRERPVGVIEV